MTNTPENFDPFSHPEYASGWTDGYFGYVNQGESDMYLRGYHQGEDDREQELADAVRDDVEMGRGDYIFTGDADESVYDEPEAFYLDAVDQGYYDDDPNPYHGDYSEM